MYETIKIVNGYRIYRMVGTRGYYKIDIWNNGKGCKKMVDFRTIKAASKWAEEH